MRILRMEPPSRTGCGPDLLAEFILELTPHIRICGLRLIKTPTGLNVHFPNVNGGGRAVTVSPELRSEIIEIAKTAYKGLSIANDNIHSAA